MNADLTISGLRDQGQRITKIRKELISIFSTISQPLSANQIASLLPRSGLRVNKTTIYRELQFLLKNGFLIEVFINPNEVSYESAELKHHHHLVCDHCGNIENVTNCLAKNLEVDVYKKVGFRIHRHMLEFYGICSRCNKRS